MAAVRKMSKNKKLLSLLITSSVVIFFSLLCIYSIRITQMRQNYGITHQTIKTLNDLRILAIAIDMCTEDRGRLPKAFFRKSTEEERAIALFEELKNEYVILPSETNLFLDHWGNPIHFRVKVKLWSNGLNGRDEGGKGDDICVERELTYWNLNNNGDTNRSAQLTIRK